MKSRALSKQLGSRGWNAGQGMEPDPTGKLGSTEFESVASAQFTPVQTLNIYPGKVRTSKHETAVNTIDENAGRWNWQTIA